MNNPFANLPNAPLPGDYGPSFKHGKYQVQTNLLLCKQSKNPKNPGAYFIAFECTILAQLEGCFTDSNEVGQRVSKVFMIQAAGWEGVYAMGTFKALIANMLGVDFDLITDAHAMAITGSSMNGAQFVCGDGTDAAGTELIVIVTDTAKTDKNGQPYTNLTFEPAP